jgi:hypothetical protein
MMPEWGGSQLDAKRKQALDAFRSSMSDMLDHKEWIQMTEVIWQLMSDRVIDAQQDIIRRERFEPKDRPSSAAAQDRLTRYTKFKRLLRALNFVFKCFEVDWSIFAETLLGVAEGRVDVKGLDNSTKRDQCDDQAAPDGQGTDDSGAS